MRKTFFEEIPVRSDEKYLFHTQCRTNRKKWMKGRIIRILLGNWKSSIHLWIRKRFKKKFNFSFFLIRKRHGKNIEKGNKNKYEQKIETNKKKYEKNNTINQYSHSQSVYPGRSSLLNKIWFDDFSTFTLNPSWFFICWSGKPFAY